MTAVSVGNPHAVAFTDNIESVPLEKIGPLIECHRQFPQRTNAHFVRVLERNEVEMITWERGTGVTLACGTGATSSVLAGYRLGLLDKEVLVHLPGGELRITVYQEDDKLSAFMEGDAVTVFEGVMNLNI
jgi:diaminopimelate epimerase